MSTEVVESAPGSNADDGTAVATLPAPTRPAKRKPPRGKGDGQAKPNGKAPKGKAKVKPAKPKPRDAKAPPPAAPPAAASPPPAGRPTPPAALREIADLFKMASDPTRLAVMAQLAAGEKNVGELCEALGQSQPATSHHLALMRACRLIEPRRDGKNNYYSLKPIGRALAGLASQLVSHLG